MSNGGKLYMTSEIYICHRYLHRTNAVKKSRGVKEKTTRGFRQVHFLVGTVHSMLHNTTVFEGACTEHNIAVCSATLPLPPDEQK